MKVVYGVNIKLDIAIDLEDRIFDAEKIKEFKKKLKGLLKDELDPVLINKDGDGSFSNYKITKITAKIEEDESNE